MTDTKTDVVLFGTGMVSEVISVYLDRYSDLNVLAYTVDRDFLPEGGTFAMIAPPRET